MIKIYLIICFFIRIKNVQVTVLLAAIILHASAALCSLIEMSPIIVLAMTGFIWMDCFASVIKKDIWFYLIFPKKKKIINNRFIKINKFLSFVN